MTKIITFIFVLAAFSPAHADSFYKLIRYDCDQQRDRVLISYIGAYNDQGQQMVENKGENAWEPSTLIEVDQSGERIKKTKVINRQCRLSDGIYRIALGAAPFTFNTQGHCGNPMAIAAWAQISKKGKVIVRRVLEGECEDTHSLITTAISLAAKSQAAELKQVAYQDFFHW